MRYVFPFGTKTKSFVHKRIIIQLQPTLFDKQIKEFNEKSLKIMEQPFDQIVKEKPKNKTKKNIKK